MKLRKIRKVIAIGSVVTLSSVIAGVLIHVRRSEFLAIHYSKSVASRINSELFVASRFFHEERLRSLLAESPQPQILAADLNGLPGIIWMRNLAGRRDFAKGTVRPKEILLRADRQVWNEILDSEGSDVDGATVAVKVHGTSQWVFAHFASDSEIVDADFKDLPGEWVSLTEFLSE